MKKVIKFLALAAVLFAAISCDKLPFVDEETSKFVGVWMVKSDQKGYATSLWILYEDGSARLIPGSSSGVFFYNVTSWDKPVDGKWTYDKETKILATTINLFQWQITLADENDWTAIGTDGKYHFTAQRFDGHKDIEIILHLYKTTWESDKFGTFSLGGIVDGFGSNTLYDGWHGCKCEMPSKIKDSEENKWNYMVIHRSGDELLYRIPKYLGSIGTAEYFVDGKATLTKLEIINPLNPAACKLVFNVAIKDNGKVIRTYEDTYSKVVSNP